MSRSSKNLLLIKIGGSSITDKSTPYKLKRDNLICLAKEISKSKYPNLIISHGSGSFGHVSAIKYGGKKGYKSKIGIATVFSDASRINQIVTDVFIQEGLPAVSFSPRSLILGENGKINTHNFKIIEEALKQGLIPVVYGDVILDKNWKTTIFSGEKTLNLLAIYLRNKGFIIEKIIQVGETAGVLGKNGNTIPVINKNNWAEIKKNIYRTGKLDVTGGMIHKVEEALELSKKGVRTLLISDEENMLFNAIIGKLSRGTII